jgi:hypothetical protein
LLLVSSVVSTRFWENDDNENKVRAKNEKKHTRTRGPKLRNRIPSIFKDSPTQ